MKSLLKIESSNLCSRRILHKNLVIQPWLDCVPNLKCSNYSFYLIQKAFFREPEPFRNNYYLICIVFEREPMPRLRFGSYHTGTRVYLLNWYQVWPIRYYLFYKYHLYMHFMVGIYMLHKVNVLFVPGTTATTFWSLRENRNKLVTRHFQSTWSFHCLSLENHGE